ncbi:MAG TPA: cation-transporting P-type ATPase [Anaeromyxobacteraceae bacterium]|nr:cation-transporting P-type ATPase [Anaeromyxobacteraceae bacterium]
MTRQLPLARLPGSWLSEEGLTSPEVEARRRDYGANDILAPSPRPWLALAADTARDPMIWFLLGTSAFYFLLGQRAEGATLLASIVPLLAMDAFLHRRTRASTEGLQSRLAARAAVHRDGCDLEVPATEVVVGDLVRVRAGDLVPADGVLVAGRDFQAEESSLTGESMPVPKHPLGAVPPGQGEPGVPGEHWAMAGTRILTGAGSMRVAYVGAETLYGEIARVSATGVRARTPLQTAVGLLVSFLVVAAVVLCLLLAVVRWRQGFGWTDALVSAATLAVAAIPEEFPVALTFFLGTGVYRLARQQALVRRAVSVEDIGRVSVICSDKTGTLTEGRLRVCAVIPAGGADERTLLLRAAWASRSESGDPLDEAILDLARERGLPAPGRAAATFPFTEDRRRETAVRLDGDGRPTAASKGAPEVILQACAMGDGERAGWAARAAELGGRAWKVVACAARPLEAAWAGAEPAEGMTLLGLVAFADPVREGVREAVAACQAARIRVVMLTGDHAQTARAVAESIGLGGGSPEVIGGEEMMAALQRGERDVLRRVDAISRALPAQKLALVRAYEEAGEIVAVTGDGVNDVPALQAADVGIAMGSRGTRSAREAAAIVLLDDNFRTIVRAIAEGRQLFSNLKRSFQYLLLMHLPLVVTAALIPFAGYPLLYLPVHIVWLELVIHPTAILAFQGAADGSRVRPQPAATRARFFSGREWVALAAGGTLVTAVVVWGYLRGLGLSGSAEHARTLALSSLCVASAGFLVVLGGLRVRIGRWIALGTLLSAALLVQTPQLAGTLHLTPLHLDDWALSIAAGALGCLPVLLGRLPKPVGASRG